MLGLQGWFSTNILGNRDGEVLDDPESFKTKEESKLSVLDHILQPELYPELYKDFYHMVRINYYPPRGDNKEGWDNIDIFGWLGYPMQIKIDFLCRDSHSRRAALSWIWCCFSTWLSAQDVRHPGVAFVLFQKPAVCAPALPGARPLHSTHEAQEHASLAARRRPHHASGVGILRLNT